MRYLSILISAFILIFLSSPLQARPVSYAGGSMIMLMNDSDRNSLHFNYSPTARYAVGYTLEHWREDDFNLHAVTLNNLLRRWNNRDSQGNLYLLSGLGVAHAQNKDHLAGFSGFAADWENRRYFISYENRMTFGDNDQGQSFFMQSGRVGIAPYVAEFGALHTWLMLEVHHMPESDDNVSITPMVRLFKGTHLAEIGISTDGKAMFNFTQTF